LDDALEVESEFFRDAVRCVVGSLDEGENTLQAQAAERVVENRPRGLARQALPPEPLVEGVAQGGIVPVFQDEQTALAGKLAARFERRRVNAEILAAPGGEIIFEGRFGLRPGQAAELGKGGDIGIAIERGEAVDIVAPIGPQTQARGFQFHHNRRKGGTRSEARP
jgi:hypothetical protein